MSDGQAHVRLRMGDLEVEYEGAASFLTSELLALVREVARLHADRPAPESADDVVTPKAAPAGPGILDLSMSTVATRLGAETGPDLAIAAAAFLTICEGREVVTRSAILDTMRAAPAHYKKSMAGNLSGSLQSLLKQKRLNETAGDKYALTVAEKNRLNATLADDS